MYISTKFGYTFSMGGNYMKVTGLITEYNPFHNGHKYHIEEAKRLTGADYIIVVMSGDFVQRGEPACMDKYLRTQMALECGADLVIELPVLFSTASAEYFALGAIKLLDSLNFIDSICFGSELGEINALEQIAQILTKEPLSFKNTLSYHLKQGNPYPVARKMALLQEFPKKDQTFYEEILSSPNNILGIEYLKALLLLDSSIKPYTIKRKNAGYHDVEVNRGISSATSIRNALLNSNLKEIRHTVPESVYTLMEQHYNCRFPVYFDDFSAELYHELLYSSTESLCQFIDMNEDLCLRMQNHLVDYKDVTNFAELLKSKNYTQTRINRCLSHILLRLKQDYLHPLTYHTTKERLEVRNRILPQYVRILGLKKAASFLLKKKGLSSDLPVITKLADARNVLSKEALTMLQMDINASHLYQQKIYSKYKTKMLGEYKQGIIIME